MLGAGLILLVTAAFGGLEAAQIPGAATFELGDTIRAAPLDVTVDRVVWVEGALPGLYLSDESNRWIGVVATVTTDHTASLSGEPAATVGIAGVRGLVGEPAPGTDVVLSKDQVLMADSSRLWPMQPRLTYEVAFLFEQAGGVDPPDQVDLVLFGHTWRADSFDGTLGWKDPEPVARATVPARPGVDAETTDEDA